jgi:hypothetical protein
MASKSQQTREAQKSRYEKRAEVRASALKTKGLSEAAIAKDSQIKALKAKIKQVISAIARIVGLDEQSKQLKEKKARKKAESEAARAAAIKGEPKEKKKAEKKAEPQKKAQAKGGKPGAKPSDSKKKSK